LDCGKHVYNSSYVDTYSEESGSSDSYVLLTGKEKTRTAFAIQSRGLVYIEDFNDLALSDGEDLTDSALGTEIQIDIPDELYPNPQPEPKSEHGDELVNDDDFIFDRSEDSADIEVEDPVLDV